MTTSYQPEPTPEQDATKRLLRWAKRRNNDPFTLRELNQAKVVRKDFPDMDSIRELFATLIADGIVETDDPGGWHLPKNGLRATTFWIEPSHAIRPVGELQVEPEPEQQAAEDRFRLYRRLSDTGIRRKFNPEFMEERDMFPLTSYKDRDGKHLYYGPSVKFTLDAIPAWIAQVEEATTTWYFPEDGNYIYVTEESGSYTGKLDWTPYTLEQLESRNDPIIYRFHDAAGQLLYIGQTINFGSRMKDHQKTKPWFVDVVNVSIERVPAHDLDRLEAEAIRDERPRYNIQHNQ